MSQTNPDNTLTVAWLMKALADGRVSMDQPIGVIVRGETRVLGVDAFELHSYQDGGRVFVMHTESVDRPVAFEPGATAAEVGL